MFISPIAVEIDAGIALYDHNVCLCGLNCMAEIIDAIKIAVSVAC